VEPDTLERERSRWNLAVLLNTNTANLFNGNLWLEIKLGTDPPLTPRQQLVTVAYAFKADSVKDGAITANSLANNAVTSAKIANNAVTTAKIANGAVTSAKLDASLLGTLNGSPPTTPIRLSSAARQRGFPLSRRGFGKLRLRRHRLWQQHLQVFDVTTPPRPS